MSKFVHMELSTSDPEAAQKFYKAVFGWKYQKMKMPDGSVYVGFTGDGDGNGIGGGMQKVQDPSIPPHWLGYVGVDSVERTIAKVEKNGGTVVLPRMEIANFGAMAIFTDPQGATFAVWESAPRPVEEAEPAATEQAAPPAEAVEQAAPGKKATKKKAAKKAPGKKAGKKTAEKATEQAAPAKKASKKAPAKKAAKKAPAKKASKKAPAKKTAKKKPSKKK